MEKYYIEQEGLKIEINYQNDKELIEKLEEIVIALISDGYSTWDGTDSMAQALERIEDIKISQEEKGEN